MSIHSWRCYTLVVFAVLYPAVAWADPGSCVEVTGSQCVVVDGKRFFPVGIYSAGVDDFPELADAGFNLVHTYGWEGISGNDWGKAWLDAAEKHGLMALVGLYRPRVRSGKFVDCLPRVEQYRSHPALLAWHTMDEPGWEKEKDRGDQYMPAAYRFLRKHDPNHPVTAVVCHFADTTRFADAVDVLQADYYPIPPIPASDFLRYRFSGNQNVCGSMAERFQRKKNRSGSFVRRSTIACSRRTTARSRRSGNDFRQKGNCEP